MNDYQFLIHQQTLTKTVSYLDKLRSGQSAGRYLRIQTHGLDLTTISIEDFLEALVQTKQPQIFAESEVSGDGSDWNMTELSILGDISVAVPVEVFDNGSHNHPVVYNSPFHATLIFTPGALLRNGRSQKPADWEEVTRGGTIDPEAYNKLYARRLLPIFYFANEVARQRGYKAFITLPGLGCGQFAGILRYKLGPYLKSSIKTILETHGRDFSYLKAVYYDPYRECENERFEIWDTQFLVRPLSKGNENKPQLCQPQEYQEIGDDFSDCQLFSIVAWDHASWPGNDFYLGSRVTDDGVKAAATDTMRIITGITGNYDPQRYKYLPPHRYHTWKEVVADKGIQLKVKNNLIIYPM